MDVAGISQSHASDLWIDKHSHPVLVFKVNQLDQYCFWRGWIVTSNIVLSFGNKSKTKRRLLHSTEKLDTDSYLFAIDTCTSESICHHRELFVDGIKKSNNIYVQGDPKSSAGVYLGHSPYHASNVALVLNLDTGLVSPHFHVVFDDKFPTVDFIKSRKEPSNWEYLCKYHSEDYCMNTMSHECSLRDIQADLERILTPAPAPAHTVEPSAVPKPVSSAEHTVPSVSLDTSHLQSIDDDQLNTHHQEGEIAADPRFNNQINEVEDVSTPEFATPTPLEGASEGVNFSDVLQKSIDPEQPPPIMRSGQLRKTVDCLTASKLGEYTNASLIGALSHIRSYFIRIQYTPAYCCFSFKAKMNH